MKFEKVFPEQFAADCDAAGFAVEYANVVMPRLPRWDAAGYDIAIPFDIVIAPNESIAVPIGVKIVDVPKNVFLGIYIKEDICMKRGLVLKNGVSVIDHDGDIWLYLKNDGKEDVEILAGEVVAFAVFQAFLVMRQYDKANA